MTTIYARALTTGALAFLTFTTGAAAQAPPSPILNTLEVQKLVTGAQPVDDAKLSSHFTALAERYETEAKQHTAMAQASAGNPNRQLATGMSAHCKRLADLNTQSATTLRELAGHHQKLAAGASSTAPHDSARFQGGAGARTPSKQDLTALAATAHTTADHRALEEYFLTAAKRYTAVADEHASMAQAYRGTKIAAAAAHCDRIVMLSRDAAKEAGAAATMHKDLAGIAR
jgi:hypothetical protein